MNGRTAIPLMLGALLTACVDSPSEQSTSVLNEDTGNTLLLAARPLVFARERSDVSAYARDYATLVAAEVDVAGHYTDYFLLYRWSTVDKRMSPPPPLDAGKLRLQADGRVIELDPLPQLPVGPKDLPNLHYPQNADVVAHAYVVNTATLTFVAMSQQIVLRMPQEPLDLPFKLREDGRRSLAALVHAEGSGN